MKIAKPTIWPEALFPLLMFLMGAGCFLFFETGRFIFISIVSGISSAACLWFTILLFRRREINLIRLSAYQTTLWYFFPLAYYPLVNVPGFLRVSDTDLANAVILIVVSITIAWVFSFLLKFKLTFPREQTAFVRPFDLLTVIFPICLAQLVLMATGAWSYQTTHAAAGEENLGPFALFVSAIALALAPLVSYNFGLLTRSQRTRGQWLILIATLAVQFAFWFVESRRTLMMLAAISAMAFSLGYVKNKFSSKQIVVTFVLTALLGLGLAQAGKVFYTMRLASYTLGAHGARISPSDLVEAMNNIPAEAVSAELQANQASRPFIIESVAIFEKYAKGYLYGKELMNDIIGLIPSAFYPGKDQILHDLGIPEEAWNRYLGVPFSDYANSLVLDGYADFSYLGFLISVLIACLSFLFTREIFSLTRNKTLTYVCIFSFLFEFMQAENQVTSFMVMSRNLILFFIFVAFIYAAVELVKLTTPVPLAVARRRRTTSEPEGGGLSHNQPTARVRSS